MKAEGRGPGLRPCCVHCQMLAFATAVAAAVGSAAVLTLAPLPAGAAAASSATTPWWPPPAAPARPAIPGR